MSRNIHFYLISTLLIIPPARALPFRVLYSLKNRCTESVATHRVVVPVTNLLSEPEEYKRAAPAGRGEVPKMVSQLQYNEPVTELERQDGWSRVYASTLRTCTSEKELKAVEAWVKSDDLTEVVPQTDHDASSEITLISAALETPVYIRTQIDPHYFKLITTVPYATRLTGIQKDGEWWQVKLIDDTEAWVPAPNVRLERSLNEAEVRDQVVHDAQQMLGAPYCWGGTSAFNATEKDALTGFDCSGLVFRLFDGAGVAIPRNSLSQFHYATRCEPAELEPGDLVFLSVPEVSPRVCHVMLYIGNDTVIEAWAARGENGAMNMQPTHAITINEKLGKPLSQIEYGEQIGRYVCYTGKLATASQSFTTEDI